MIVHILFFALLVLATVWSIKLIGQYVSRRTSSKIITLAVTTAVGLFTLFTWFSALDLPAFISDINGYLAKSKFDNLFELKILRYILKFDVLAGIRGFNFSLLGLCILSLGMMLTHREVNAEERKTDPKPVVSHTLTNFKCDYNLNTFIINGSLLR